MIMLEVESGIDVFPGFFGFFYFFVKSGTLYSEDMRPETTTFP